MTNRDFDAAEVNYAPGKPTAEVFLETLAELQ
jgi:hypothetical protein